MRRRSLLPAFLLCFCLLLPVAGSAQDRYLGSISLVPWSFAQKGTASCNGQLLSIQQNQALFALLGTTYGGDGRVTFALPDLRGRFAIGFGSGPGLSTYNEGDRGGVESVTLTIAQIPAHTHQAIAASTAGNTVDPTSAYWSQAPRLTLYSAASNLTPMSQGAVGLAGGNQPHENRKPFLTLNYVIWLQGIFPSRN